MITISWWAAWLDYKRVDLAIKACNRLKRKLRIIEKGDQSASLRSLAGPTVEFLGHAQSAKTTPTAGRSFFQARKILEPFRSKHNRLADLLSGGRTRDRDWS